MVGVDSILVATGNSGKLREVAAVLGDLGIGFITLADVGDLPEAVEDQSTFEGNAALKAVHYSRLTGRWTLADDSGLEVDALDGRPGVYSARYAGPQRDDLANNAKLIADLATVGPQNRTARFRCAMCVASRDTILAAASGTFEGMIIDETAGENGFGYDPHFFVPEFQMTCAQMQPELKNRISHRGQALRALAESLRPLLQAAREKS